MSEEEPTDDSEQQAEEQPTDSEQPAAQSDDAPADSDQPAEQSDEQPAGETDQPTEQSEEQPAEQSEEQPAESDQPAEQSEERPADSDQPAEQAEEQPTESDQPAQQSGDQPARDSDGQGSPSDDKPTDDSDKAAGQSAGQPAQQSPSGGGGSSGQLSAGRQKMLDLINHWMPTSIINPRVDGKSVKPGEDLLAKAGWFKSTGEDNKKKKDAGQSFATSCGDVLKALLTLWKSNFLGAFNIRDSDSTGRGPGAKARGFYVERDKLVIEGDVVKSPKPGDIIVLRNGIGKAATGVGHVGILVEAQKDKWRTADGGGGSLPDQTAQVTDRAVRWVDGVPIMKSVTDIKEKELDGWIDLDKLEQTG